MDPDLARIEHAEAEDVAVLDRARADDLGEERQAHAQQAAGLAPVERRPVLLLLLAQLGVADRVERLVQRRVVVAAVVLPAHRRGVRELLLLDEVLAPQLGGVHVELAREHVDHPLDEVARLGHPERAAVRDAAGRLVGVHAVDRDVRRGDVVRAGADVEEAGRPLGRVRAGVEGAVVRDGAARQPRDAAVLGRADAALHVVVAGEGGRHQVLGAVLDPLDRDAGEEGHRDRADVARVDPDLVAEAAADVRRDDADVVLGQRRDQRGHRPDRVRRLEGAVDRHLAVDLVVGRDAAAGLERTRVDALVGDQLLGHDLAAGQRLLGGVGVAELPVEDVVVVIALAVRALGLVLDVLAEHRGALVHRLERVGDRRQLLVLDLDRGDAVGGRVAVGRDHEGDLLALEQDLLVGEHRLDVARQGRHPGQVVGRELLGGDHRHDALDRGGRGDVDVLDLGVGVRRAHEVAEQHARQLDVVDVASLALDEARVLDALAGGADALQAFPALGGGGGCFAHLDSPAAAWMALTMFW